LNGHRFLNVSNAQAKTLRDEGGLKRGMYITSNLINRTQQTLISYFQEKGYYNCQVLINRIPAKDKDGKEMPGFENFDIDIIKGPKVKVYDFVFVGNNEVETKELRQSIKKMKRRYHKVNLFVSSKYLESKWEEEKSNLISHYLELGYRDARILKDSVVLLPS